MRPTAWATASGTWRLEPGDYDFASACLGFCLGAYHFGRFRAAERRGATLVVPAEHAASVHQAQATWMVRDLINTPANLLGPRELAEFAEALDVTSLAEYSTRVPV